MATKGRSNDLQLLAISWLMLTVTFTCVWWVANGVVWLVFGILAAVISGGTAYAHYRREGRWSAPVQAKPTATTKQPVYKSRRRLQREKREAVAAGKIRSGWTRMGTGLRGARTCSVRCRNSRMPNQFCRCHCGGASHGELRRPAVAVAALVAKPKPKAPTPAARKKAPARKTGQPTRKAAPPKAAHAGGPPKKREVEIPDGPPGLSMLVTWRADDGKLVSARTSRATAQVLKDRGRLVEARVPTK